MDVLALSLRRQSDRNYLNQPVEPEKVIRILECARMAPSACNAQLWKVIIISGSRLPQSHSR